MLITAVAVGGVGVFFKVVVLIVKQKWLLLSSCQMLLGFCLLSSGLIEWFPMWGAHTLGGADLLQGGAKS